MAIRRALFVMSLAFVAVVGLVAPASAHAAYKSSDPPDDGQVSAPPGEVTATFTEPLANGSFLQITDPCGDRVDDGNVQIVGYDMSVSMSGAAAGRYTVFYRAFSTLDPHVTEGTFGFTATGGEPCAGEADPEDSTDSGGGSPRGDDPASSDGQGSSGAPSTDRDSSTQTDGAAGTGMGTRTRAGSDDPGTRTVSNANRRSGGDAPGAETQLAAGEDEPNAPSVWDGIRLEPFLTGLLLAAIIGAAGGKMYAGIMGPRA